MLRRSCAAALVRGGAALAQRDSIVALRRAPLIQTAWTAELPRGAVFGEGGSVAVGLPRASNGLILKYALVRLVIQPMVKNPKLPNVAVAADSALEIVVKWPEMDRGFKSIGNMKRTSK